MMKRILLLIILLLWSNFVFAYDCSTNSDCIGAWLFDVNEDPQRDSSQNSNTLTATGSPTYTTTSPPKSYSTAYYDFDVSNPDYMRKVGASSDFEMTAGTSAFTFTCWVNPDAFGPLSFDDNIMGHIDNDGDDGWGFAYGNTDDVIVYTVGGNTGDIDTSMSVGAWTHLAAIYDQANTTVQVYENGSSIYNNTSYANTSVITSGDADLTFGINDALITGNAVNGQLDELGFFNVALDSTDINDIMDNGLYEGSTAYQRGVMIFD